MLSRYLLAGFGLAAIVSASALPFSAIAQVPSRPNVSTGAIDPSPIPAFWTCAGNCGTDGADGVVPLSPTGNTTYEWVSTSGGVTGAGVLPAGAQGSETDGSTLATPVFSATAGTALNFYFNYVTSDGAGYADYAWAELYDSSNNPVALLFTARTEESGSIIPGTALPSPAATLIPASVPILPGTGTQCGSGECNSPAGGPSWPELGGWTGDCWAVGCGYTGWVKATYTIPKAGNYYLKVGVINWLDELYDSGLAVDGVTLNGVPITLLSGTLDVEYGTDAALTTWLGLVSATDSTGKPLDMKDAAQQLGYDHFNWLQIDISDSQISACAANPTQAGCSGLFTITGTVPPIPTVDPPEGGWAYQLCSGTPAGCATSFPVQDFWPMYLDEYFAPVDSIHYAPNPGAPEYLQEFRAGNTLKQMGAANQSPGTALGFSFSDAPTTAQNIKFVDALVGVKGSCNNLGSSNCSFAIIPGTTFQWTAANGAVTPNVTPGGPGSTAWLPIPWTGSHAQVAKQLNDFPVNPTDLTGLQLQGSIISVAQFLSLANLNTQSLAAMGGSVATVSASLVPDEAAALAAVEAGGTLVPPNEVATTASGLVYSRVTQMFSGTVTITNTGAAAITGPLQVLLTGLPATVTLANATGSFAGIPYLTVPSSGLSPGQAVSATVQFKNPANAIINFVPSVYSGAFK